MEKNGMKEYRQPKVTVVNFKVERAIAGSQCQAENSYGIADGCYEC